MLIKKYFFYFLLIVGSFSMVFAAEQKSNNILQYKDENGKDVIHKNNLIRAEDAKGIVYVKTCDDKAIHVSFKKSDPKKLNNYSMTTNYFNPYFWEDEKKKEVAKKTFQDIEEEFKRN